MNNLEQRLYDAALSIEEDNDGYLIALRMGSGHSKKKFEELCQVLMECGNAWKDSDSIPKWGATIIIELVSSMGDRALYYRGKRRLEIVEASARISQIVMDYIE